MRYQIIDQQFKVLRRPRMTLPKLTPLPAVISASEKHQMEVMRAELLLQHESVTVEILTKYRKSVLQMLCSKQELAVKGSKQVLATRLLENVSS